MERVERLASNSNPSVTKRYPANLPENNSSILESSHNKDQNQKATANTHEQPSSPSKCFILKKLSQDCHLENPPHRQQSPVSILKHKTSDGDGKDSSMETPHVALPVTFSPCVIEPLHKRHGILKKRSSLDESEIMRRRSCSPDVSISENNSSEFRPILKNQRRSSLDEIVRRAQSPDPYPTSILKRKSSREDESEDRQLSPEPQVMVLKQINLFICVSSKSRSELSFFKQKSSRNFC